MRWWAAAWAALLLAGCGGAQQDAVVASAADYTERLARVTDAAYEETVDRCMTAHVIAVELPDAEVQRRVLAAVARACDPAVAAFAAVRSAIAALDVAMGSGELDLRELVRLVDAVGEAVDVALAAHREAMEALP